MAGHSKWANIQHRKGRQDAKRGKLFTRLIREITVASRLGGSDLDGNPRLRGAVDVALSSNMTKNTIERAIKRGPGLDNAAALEEVYYEGYGSCGIAIMLLCMTDNRKRTVAEVRHAFSKYGGNLGTDGCVAHLFTKIGLLGYDADADEDQLTEVGLEAGAEDLIKLEDGGFELLTASDDFHTIKEIVVAAGLAPKYGEITLRPNVLAKVESSKIDGVLKLLDALEDLDDVQQVWTNAEFLENAQS
ncbi:MAG: YebC/PmpR family DNA-binding transcriptional regulator [Candidatus Eutrophobiaceae bacterium]